MAGGIRNGTGGVRSRRGGGRRFTPMSEINVTPFVDVMLVLLVIFMVAAPLLTVGVPIDLPDTEARPLQNSDEPLAVSIAADARIYIQDTEIELETLVPKLNEITRNNRDVRIVLRADKAIDYGRVLTVLAKLNGAGFKRVALISDTLAS